ncbi:MAG TPA: hypothetical protein VKY37_04260 [Brumimicrobium sp.]|nr:hypothetical protein [Brumimicrobium sp.]
MRTIHIDILDKIKGMECSSCEKRFVITEEEFKIKGTVKCPHCDKKKFTKLKWEEIINLKKI